METRREWLTTKEVADELGVTPGRVRQWLANDELPSQMAGGTHLIHRDALLPFRTRKTAPGPARRRPPPPERNAP